MSDDLQYHFRRALQEEDAAARTTCIAARERHEELATLHLARCEPAVERSEAEIPLRPLVA